MSGNPCGFRGSAQHLRAVYSPESESPKFFAGVDLDAARSCPVRIGCSRKGRFSSAGIAATKTKRERALLEFAYSTGCRVSEMAHLRVENIDFEGRSVRVRGQFNKTRIAFLTPSASAALRAYIQDRKSGYVFQEDRRQQHAGISADDG
jgi:integrase-like protein